MCSLGKLYRFVINTKRIRSVITRVKSSYLTHNLTSFNDEVIYVLKQQSKVSLKSICSTEAFNNSSNNISRMRSFWSPANLIGATHNYLNCNLQISASTVQHNHIWGSLVYIRVNKLNLHSEQTFNLAFANFGGAVGTPSSSSRFHADKLHLDRYFYAILFQTKCSLHSETVRKLSMCYWYLQ